MIPHRAHNFGTYFVTAQTWNRRSLFHSDELAQLLVDTFSRYRQNRKFELHEFVIMPDHLHAIITPSEVTIEGSMQLIKGGYSHAVGQTGRKALEIWQRGYTDHRVRDFSDYEQHRIYIHQNPVRKELCQLPEEYRWSSAFPGFELDEVPQRLKPLVMSGNERHS